MNEYTNIGEIIKYYREKKHLSQEALAEGICAREYIGKIERNMSSPSIDMINQLSNKLEINLYDSYAMIIEHKNLETHFKITQLNEAIGQRNFEELWTLTQHFSEIDDFKDGIPFQFLKYSQALYYSMYLNNYPKSLECALEGLKQHFPSILSLNPTQCTLTNADLVLMQTIAVNLCRIDCLDQGLLYFNFLSHYLEHILSMNIYLVNRNKHFELNFLAHIAYNRFIFLADYNPSEIHFVDMALEILKKYYYSHMLPELLLCRTLLQCKSSDINNARQTYACAHNSGIFLYGEPTITKLEQKILNQYYKLFASQPLL